MNTTQTPYAWFGWGEHILKFYKSDSSEIRLDVCDWLHRSQGSYFFESPDQLKQLAQDESCALRFYLGGYGFHATVSNSAWNDRILPCLNKYKVFETISV